MRKIRVDTPSETKILTLRDDAGIPRTYDDLVALVLSRMPSLAGAARSKAVALSIMRKDGTSRPIGDDDVATLWKNGTTPVIVPAFDEATGPAGSLPWSRERVHAQLEKLRRRPPTPPPEVAAAGSVEPQTPIRGSQHQNGDDTTQSPTASEPQTPRPLALDTPPPTPAVSFTGHQPLPSAKEAHPDTLQLPTDSTDIVKSQPVALSEAPPKPTLEVPPDKPSAKRSSTFFKDSHGRDVVRVKSNQTELDFPLVWRSAQPGHELIVMGVLGKPEWAAQRAVSYKLARLSERRLTLSYEPQLGGMLQRMSHNTRFKFTLFFDTQALFNAAKNAMPPSVPSLDRATFLLAFLHPLRAATEWACVQPPRALVEESPNSGSDYHIAYVVKEAGRDLDPACAERVRWWLTEALLGGEWGSAKSRKASVLRDYSYY